MSSFPWRIIRARRADAMKRRQGGKNGPWFAGITEVNPQRERVKIVHQGGSESVRVTHPFLSTNSWIRVMPEAGAGAIVYHRQDTQLPEISSYFISNPQDSTAAYEGQRNLYQPLEEGEIEIRSVGVASAHFSKEGTLAMRGGVNTLELDNEDLRITSQSATHERRAHQSRGDTLCDVERFGVVRRGEGKFADKFVKFKGRCAKEYLRLVHADPDTPLIDHREGDVYDNNGLRAKHGTTNKNLRSRTRYYTETLDYVQTEVDVEGNTALSLPVTATKGLAIKVPKGETKLVSGSAIANIAENLSMSTGKDVTIQVGDGVDGSFRVTALKDIRMTCKVRFEIDAGIGGTLHLKAGQIFLNNRVVNSIYPSSPVEETTFRKI